MAERGDPAHLHPRLVGQGDSERGRREEAALLEEELPADVGGDDHHERDGRFEVVGYGERAQGEHEQRGGRDPHCRSDDGGEDHLDDGVVAADHHLQHDECEGRADRIDDDALPAQDRGRRLPGSGGAQERSDDGRAADDEEGTEQHGQVGRQAEERPRHDGHARPCDQYADRHELHDRPGPSVTELLDVETEATLEQQQGDGHGHDREERLAEDLVGVDDPEPRADDQP